VRVQAKCVERELRHIGLADDDRPCLTKAPDNNSIGLSWSRGAPKNRTGRSGFPSNVEKILDGDDLAIERA